MIGCGVGTTQAAARALLAAPPLAIPDEANIYTADTFSPSGTLQGRANWANVAGGAIPSVLVADAEGYMRNTNQYQSSTELLFGPSGGFGADFEAAFEYSIESNNGDTWATNAQGMRIWQEGSTGKRGSLQLDPTNNRITMRLDNGTNIWNNRFWEQANLPTTGTLTIVMKDGRMRVRVGRRWLWQSTSYPQEFHDFTGMPSAQRAGGLGYQLQTWRYRQLNSIKAKPLDVDIGFVYEFVGRDSASATGGTNHIFLWNAAGWTPTTWIGRVLDYATGDPVTDWVELGDSTRTSPHAGYSVAKTIFMPMGGPYVIEAGFIAAEDGLRHTTLSRVTRAGYKGVVAGQSNAAFRITKAGAGLTKNQAAGAMVPGTVDPNRQTLSNTAGIAQTHLLGSADNVYTVTPYYAIAREAAASLGAPVVMQGNGIGGVSLATLSNGTTFFTDLINGLAFIPGIPDFLIWDQGENDADGVFPPTGYGAQLLNNFIVPFRTQSGNPNLRVFISPVGRYTSATPPSGGDAATRDAQREVLRQEFEWAIANDPAGLTQYGSFKMGCVHEDAYHYTPAACVEMCRRDGLTVGKALGGTGHDGLGPRITGAALSGDRTTITLTLDLNAATGLTDIVNVATGTVPTAPLSGGLYGYQISGNDFTSLLTISTIVRSGSQLVITLASAAPAGTVKIRSMYGWSFDDTNLFYGTYADGNIPVRPIITPITATGG